MDSGLMAIEVLFNVYRLASESLIIRFVPCIVLTTIQYG